MTRQQQRATLRQYQKDAVSQVCRAAKRGDRRITVCQPVGSGKTEVIAELCRIARYPLVIVPQLTLMRQARDRLEMRLDEQCDIEQGAFRAGTTASLEDWFDPRIIVGSRDSLLSNDRYKSRIYERVSLVVVDECHVGMSPRFEMLLQWFLDRGATVVGFSATPYKGKGKALRFWPRPQVVYSLMQGMNDGYLVGPKCFMSEARSFDMSKVDEVAGEWNKAQLAAVLTAEHFAQEVVGLTLETYAGQPSVVYAASRRQAALLAEVFERYQQRVSLVHSRQSLDDRYANMQAFLSGETKIIVNVGILGYGWDYPELRNIYMAAPTRSLSRYEQRLGRGTRVLKDTIHVEMTREERLAAIAASDKPFFNVYDITDSSGTHQLLSALDVLDAKCRKSVARRERMRAGLGMEGIAATDAIKQADEQDLEALQERMREVVEKRKRLCVGVTFDHTTRDLFSEPVRRKRGWRMLYGKYEGQTLDSIPEGYLSWVLQSTKKDTPFRQAVRRELTRRQTAKKPS